MNVDILIQVMGFKAEGNGKKWIPVRWTESVCRK